MNRKNITTIEQFDLYQKLHSILLKTILFGFLIIITVALLIYLFFNNECNLKNVSIGIIISSIMFGFRVMVVHFFTPAIKVPNNIENSEEINN